MKFNYYKPARYVILFNVLAFLLLYLKLKEKQILYYGIFVMAIISFVYLFIKWRQWGDLYLFLIVSMLTSIGIVMLFRLDYDLGKKQIVWFLGGVILFLLSSTIVKRIKFWPRLTYFYIGSSLAFFILTLTLGTTRGGATNWIIINGFSIQPSEVIKLLFIFFLASYYTNHSTLKLPDITVKGKVVRVDTNIILSLIAYGYMIFFVMQREWGGALLIFLVHIIMLFVFGQDMKLILANGILAIFGGSLGVLYVPHIKVRISTWLNPWVDIADKGYQITQSLFAIGSGGFFGRGIGLGSPRYIPKVETDFIFSAICEEMGIFGGVAVILLYFILVYRGFKIALSVEETFYKALALGITLLFGLQTFIIIGGVIKLIPLTGITLPFISYGGSSLTTSFISLGILQAVSFKGTDGLGGNDE